LLRKEVKFKWSEETKEDFNKIKEWIAKAPVLVRPNFYKEFIFYSYASNEVYIIMLMQKDDEVHERPITFLSLSLKGYQLQYT